MESMAVGARDLAAAAAGSSSNFAKMAKPLKEEAAESDSSFKNT
jgi:hypothetical protein